MTTLCSLKVTIWNRMEGEMKHKLVESQTQKQRELYSTAAVTASKVTPWPHLQVLKPPAPLRLDQGRSGSQQRRTEQQHF